MQEEGEEEDQSGRPLPEERLGIPDGYGKKTWSRSTRTLFRTMLSTTYAVRRRIWWRGGRGTAGNWASERWI